MTVTLWPLIDQAAKLLVIMLALSISFCVVPCRGQTLPANVVVLLKQVNRADTFILWDELNQTGPHLPVNEQDAESADRYVTNHKLADMVILSRGQGGGEQFARNCSCVLLDESIYDRRLLRKCFNPFYMFRLWKGKQSVLLLLDFHCRQAELVVRSKQDTTIFKVSRLGMGRQYAILMRLARHAFPHEPRLKRLPQI